MAKQSAGIDVGASTVKVLRGEVKGTTFIVSDFIVTTNPGGTCASGWQALASAGPKKLGNVRVGVTGREVNVRYTRVPRLPDWQLRKLMRFEAAEVGGQSESEVASDFNVLPEIPEIEGEDVVILCMARESLLQEHTTGLAAAKGSLDCFTPNAIALYNAFLHYGVVMDDTVLLANIGHQNMDIVLVRGTDLLFARNMTGGSKLFDEAIAARFDVSLDRAEAYKIEEGTLDIQGPFADANQEKAARALTGPAGQILSLLQSAVMFAKGQVKLNTLKADRVLLCGGGAALPGLDRFLASAMGVPVEVFDPFVVVDTSKLDPARADQLEAHKLEAVCALGLATSGSDPNSYGIEILSESVRKKREFLQGTTFLIAAAVLAILYLGFYASWESNRLADLNRQAQALSTRFRRASSQHQRTSALLEENRQLDGRSRELFAIKGAGEGVARALDTIERKLPRDFWLERMSVSSGFDEELGIERQDEAPILHLKGRAREGTDSPTVQWEEFLASLRAELPEARIKDRMGQTDFTLDMSSLGRTRPEPEADTSGFESDQEGDG